MAKKKPSNDGSEPTTDELLEEQETDEEGEPEPEPLALTDKDLDQIAEVITAAQIDRLVKLRAQIDRRDAYRRQGISPATHVMVVSGAVHMYKGKRRESKAGDALEIEHLDSETHEHLLKTGLAERPV